MASVAIRVEGLSKRFEIGRRERRSGTLREALAASVKRPLRRLAGRADAAGDAFVWALRDVSFDVRSGEVLGVVGRNGAGKSTLLKILSRITKPTEGRATVFGRVGSLLEVGTGFHAELTGRENVYLNGAILGMQKAEIDRKFDEIVAFAEVETFLDTPVKHYSSGMYMRLAFAVAAHLEPEILLVDEVLAVGDAAFQKKCLGKMGEVAKGGRTILFVSHNMAAVQRLCSRALLIEKGRLAREGSASDVVSYYLSESVPRAYVGETSRSTSRPVFLGANLLGRDGAPAEMVLSSEPIDLLVSWRLPTSMPHVRVGLGINSADGQRIFGSAPEDGGVESPSAAGDYEALVRVPPDVLLAGRYTVALCLWGPGGIFDYPDSAFSFRVEPGVSPAYRVDGAREGLVQVLCGWDVRKDEGGRRATESPALAGAVS